MSGIAGVVTLETDSRASHEAAAALRAMARPTHGPAATVEPAPGAALGYIGRSAGQSPAGIASVGSSSIVFDGELHRPGEYANGAASGAAATPSDAAYLLRGYLSDGVPFLRGLEGRFTAAIWNGDQRRLTLICDKFGSKPLYFTQRGRQFAFASEIKSLLALPWASKELSRRGLVQFFTYGQFWNQDTLFAAVQCCGPASLTTFDADRGKLTQERYWQARPAERMTEAASLENIDAQFKAAVDDRTRDAAHLGISLSGGLDARTVLALCDRAPAPPICVSLGMEGSLDQRSARRLAELSGCDYHTLVLDQDFLTDFERHLRDMAALTDGHYLSQCIVMPTLPLYERLGIRTLLRGHAGELVHLRKAYNFSVDDSVHGIGGTDALHGWLYPRLQSHLTAGVAEPVIRGVSHGQFAELAHESLQTALEATSAWEHPVDRISQLFLDQRTHRETAASLAKIGSVVDIRVPYLDGRFVEAVFAAPIELRMSERIQTHILARRRPEFLKPANSNTGAPVTAGRLRRELSYFRMKVLGKLGVKGYQPYERLGLWLRRELKPTVERLLLSPACLDRGVLEPDAVRNSVKRHFEGQQNHTFLLMAMMILEVGFEASLDGRPAQAPLAPAPWDAQPSRAPNVLGASVAAQ